jgi:threonine/homoserine/homoserine lactone efflux protein
MIDITGFVLVILPLALSPGTSFVLVMSNLSLSGFKSIFPVIIGTALGIWVHAILSGFGISLLLAQHDLAMAIVNYIGIAFLLYIGVRLIYIGIKSRHSEYQLQGSLTGVKKAFLLNLVNVRPIVLYLTVAPAFASPHVLDFLVLSTVHIVIMVVWIIICALAMYFAKLKFPLNTLRLVVNTLGGFSLIALAIKLSIS